MKTVAVIDRKEGIGTPRLTYDGIASDLPDGTKLVPESALAELFDSSLKAQSVHTSTVAELHAAEANLATLISGLEALAGEMISEGYAGSDEARGPIYNFANKLRALIPAAANTESEETNHE